MFSILCRQGRKLLVIGTTSRKDVLRDFEMLNVFSQIVHVSNISDSEGLLAVLENAEIFSKRELEQIQKKTHGKRSVGAYGQRRDKGGEGGWGGVNKKKKKQSAEPDTG